jgi:succinyl-diaminopimelate desuccinylase
MRRRGRGDDGADLLALAAQLVDIPSVSHNEAVITDWLEQQLRAVPWLETTRIGDNLVARTNLGRPQRLVLGGHTDTVPISGGNGSARIDGDVLWGLGAADMKGGLAVMLELARTVSEPAVDVTYVFYAREEVAIEHSGLREIDRARPELLRGDVAILGEPTAATLEAGCQGSMRLRVTLCGVRAHTARAWLGRNAIHRLGRLLGRIDDYEPREPLIQGCRYHEGLQAVFVEGGTAANVVPDRAVVTLNHRFAPDRTPAEAEAQLRELLDPFLEPRDTVEVVDVAIAAAPHLDHPLLAAFAGRNDLAVRAKLGWTDVAFFAERGIPAANFGPGDAELSHTAGEHVEREFLEFALVALGDLLRNGV